MLDEKEDTGRNRSHADRPVAVIVIVLVSDRDPRCISRLRCCRYFQECAHRVTPLIRESPRDYVSSQTVIRSRRADVQEPCSCYEVAEIQDVEAEPL